MHFSFSQNTEAGPCTSKSLGPTAVLERPSEVEMDVNMTHLPMGLYPESQTDLANCLPLSIMYFGNNSCDFQKNRIAR